MGCPFSPKCSKALRSVSMSPSERKYSQVRWLTPVILARGLLLRMSQCGLHHEIQGSLGYSLRPIPRSLLQIPQACKATSCHQTAEPLRSS